MKKALIVMSLALLLENTGSLIDNMLKTATFQGVSSSKSAISMSEHDKVIQEGTDPSGMALSG